MFATLGEYEFEVSSESIKTFSDLKLSDSASYTEHKIHGQAGLLEFTGLNAGSASLKMILDSALGLEPKDEAQKFIDSMNEHEALAFTLGGEVIGRGLWVIESIERSFDRIDNTGYVNRIELTLKLKEYAGND